MKIDRIRLECPYELPLDRGAFALALRKGQGRALLHVMRHGAGGVEDLILDACLHDQRFDPQCEDGRAPWLIQIVDAAGLEATACQKVAAALGPLEPEASVFDCDQMCGLSLELARRGHAAARQALYGAFSKAVTTADLIAGEEIIALVGSDGLLFVAQKTGEWIQADPETDVLDYLLHCYDEHHGEGAAEAVLRLAAAHNERVAAFLERVRPGSSGAADRNADAPRVVNPKFLRFSQRGGETLEQPTQSIPVEQVIEDITYGGPGQQRPPSRRYSRWHWADCASDEDLRRVQEALFAATEPWQLAAFLRVFSRRAAPEFDDRLLALADHPDKSVRRAAVIALSNIAHPAVRALAMNRLRAGRHDARELGLFARNYESNDWDEIWKRVRWPDHADEFHWVMGDLLDVFEANADDARDPLHLVYEHTRCTNCRYRAVKRLLELGVAAEWLVEECRWDSQDRIREAVA